MILIPVVIGLELSICVIYGFAAAKRRYWNILIAIDQLCNAIGGGAAGETMSERAARQAHKTGWHALGRILDKLDPGHMARAGEDRKHKPGWQ